MASLPATRPSASLLLWVGITRLVLTLAGWDEDTARASEAH